MYCPGLNVNGISVSIQSLNKSSVKSTLRTILALESFFGFILLDEDIILLLVNE